MNEAHLHDSHPAIVKRLNRATGHLRSVIEMIQEGRSCVDIAQQLHAVERAIGSAKKALINNHIDHCLSDVQRTDGVETAAAEFRAVSKYL